ncbi:MAG: Slp family lipoprotein [Candidatus Thiodiazotropha taylori]|nr:Slp family lipoprotein [Candidatus Thiodiazotropha endolucinida]MCW4228890.1 Slp family lipoprotein [Candidatus Thiodiazotropha taylori]
MNRQSRRILLIVVGSLIISSCASKIPLVIRTPVDGDIRVDEVQQDAEPFVGSRVRWGGEIISVENLADETHIEILSQRLSKSGKPLDSKKSYGRFIARMDGFMEPEDFPKERLITVVGQLQEVVEKPVGEYPYSYPQVKVRSYHLWPKQIDPAYQHRYFYDPFYDPFYYPYWRRHPIYW